MFFILPTAPRSGPNCSAGQRGPPGAVGLLPALLPTPLPQGSVPSPGAPRPAPRSPLECVCPAPLGVQTPPPPQRSNAVLCELAPKACGPQVPRVWAPGFGASQLPGSDGSFSPECEFFQGRGASILRCSFLELGLLTGTEPIDAH